MSEVCFLRVTQKCKSKANLRRRPQSLFEEGEPGVRTRLDPTSKIAIYDTLTRIG